MKAKLEGDMVKVEGTFSELMRATIHSEYENTPGGDVVKVHRALANILEEDGTAGPGRGDPPIAIYVEREEIDGGETIPWDDLTEINGIGEKRKEEIREVLTGG